MKQSHPGEGAQKPSSKKTAGRIALAVLLALLLLAAAAYWYYHSKVGLLDYDDGRTAAGSIDESASDLLEDAAAMEQATAGLDEKDAVGAEGDILVDKDVVNILLIGTDERTRDFSENARGDTCMLLSINTKTTPATLTLVSFERGMGVPILDGQYAGQWDWLTHTFRYGGADLLMQEIRENFKLDVNYYVRVNFNTFKAGIDAVGGVDVELTEAEAKYFRDGAGWDLHAGLNHLDGEQALGYARLREIDSDWSRIVRQRNVVQAAIYQTRSLSILEINSLLDTMLPLVKTNLTEAKITELLLLAPQLRGMTAAQMTIPAKDTYGSMTGMGGRRMFAVDFDANARLLRQALYGVAEDGE